MRSFTILIVDDFEPFRKVLSQTVQKRAEFRVVGDAADGLDAVRKAQDLRPDLILLDIGLPGLNGIEAARQILRVAPDSKILFVSQESSPAVVQEALQLGGRGYLMKSDATELLAAIDAVLQGNQFVSREVTPGRNHEVASYRDDASFVDDFARFIEASLIGGNPVIVAVSEAHEKSLHQMLQARGWDIDSAMQDRRYVPLNIAHALSTYMVNDRPDPTRFFKGARELIRTAAKGAKGKQARITACGECAPTLWGQGNPEAAIELEHLWDDLARAHDINVLCGYILNPENKEDERIFQRICAEHSKTRTY